MIDLAHHRLAHKPALTLLLALGVLASTALPACPAHALIVWTDWQTATPGEPGVASGTADGVAVTYSGEILANLIINGTSTAWNPASSFTGGSVTTSPDGVGDIITLAGSSSSTNTVSFSSPVVDPVLAIWSLGSVTTNTTASFTFDAVPVLQAGGPNAQFGGSAVTVAGNVVTGFEGNGVVQFTGTFDSISWTNTPEGYYGFSVGIVPEPTTTALLGLGLAGIAVARRMRR